MAKINETNYPRRQASEYAPTDMLIVQPVAVPGEEHSGDSRTTRVSDLKDYMIGDADPSKIGTPAAGAYTSASNTNAQNIAALDNALANYDHLTKQIATQEEINGYISDPTTAEFNVIYLLKDTSTTGSDKYFEYMRLGTPESSTFEMTGDTSTDLSNYFTKAEINAALAEKMDVVNNKGSATKGVYFDANGDVQEMSCTLEKSVPSDAVFTDTKNTAGSTNTNSKLFLIGAASQAANPQTYSQEGTYINANGILYSRNETVALMRILADIYMLGKEYEVGDYCYSNISGTPPLGGTFLYKCIQGIALSTSQTAPPNGTYWKVVRAMEELSEKGTDLPLEVVNGKLNIIYEEE